ncbi:Uncharacterised protein [uncultured archaeon]|nr:Uncharacterised protein [uncultured archaeon]
MTKSGILPILTILATVIASSLAPTAFAACSTCGAEQDWGASATSFIEGKPINDTPSS